MDTGGGQPFDILVDEIRHLVETRGQRATHVRELFSLIANDGRQLVPIPLHPFTDSTYALRRFLTDNHANEVANVQYGIAQEGLFNDQDGVSSSDGSWVDTEESVSEEGSSGFGESGVSMASERFEESTQSTHGSTASSTASSVTLVDEEGGSVELLPSYTAILPPAGHGRPLNQVADTSLHAGLSRRHLEQSGPRRVR